jgi:hypothetical protein
MTLSLLRISSATSLIRWTIPTTKNSTRPSRVTELSHRQHYLSLRPLVSSSSSSSAAAPHYGTHHQSSTSETTIFAIELPSSDTHSLDPHPFQPTSAIDQPLGSQTQREHDSIWSRSLSSSSLFERHLDCNAQLCQFQTTSNTFKYDGHMGLQEHGSYLQETCSCKGLEGFLI